MQTNIHAIDNESYFRLQSKLLDESMYFPEWSVFNYTAFTDVCPLHDSFEFRFEFNSQSSNTKNYSNFDDCGNNFNKDFESEDRSPVTSTGKTESVFDSELDLIWNLVNSPNTDLNKLVDDVISSAPLESITPIQDTLDITKNNTNKRMRKSVYQVKILKKEYNFNSSWTKEDMLDVGKKSGLTHYQVYKWYWEQKKSNDKPKFW